MNEITSLTASQIARHVREKQLSAEQVLEAFLKRIRSQDAQLRAFLIVLEEQALQQARALDGKISQGLPVGCLAGVPIAVKDNILIKGVETTCGSKILKGYRAVYDATVIERLRAEDAIFLGKTNLDEFAMGSSTENSGFFPTRNPWDLSRVPGGSSGGSAAAVAARMAPLALGSDTGGSIRQPAAFCGILGFKPAYGAVSRYGLVAFASSLDQIGPLARSVEDVVLCLSAIAGHDPKDSTSAPRPSQNHAPQCLGDIRGLRLGLPKEYFSQGLSAEVGQCVHRAMEVFRKLGAEIVEVSLPHTRYALSCYYILAPSEASANLARFDGIRYGARARGNGATPLQELYESSRGEGFGAEVKRRIMLGTYALSSGYYDAYYRKAEQVRTLIRLDFDQAFKQADVLLTPTAPSVAFRLGEKADPLQMYLSDIFTIPCNLAGLAGMSMPCGLSSESMPIGIQLLCAPGKEGLLLKAASRFEESCPFSQYPQGVEA